MADTYDKLHGSNDWDKLLDPLDLDLRKLVVEYGDLASAAERAFNNDVGSQYCGYSRYGKSTFFDGVMLPSIGSKYDVTSFLYSTVSVDFFIPILFPGLSEEGSKYESNWMGFIAVSNEEYTKTIGRREILVVWRGTIRNYEWINNFQAALVSPEPVLPGPTSLLPSANALVSDGWMTIYTTSNPDSRFIKSSARDQLLARIKDLLTKYKNEKVSVSVIGHSLGASLATLSAVDLAVNAVPSDIRVSCFPFASPRVGNDAFKKKIEALPNLKILRVTNALDIVPQVPIRIIPFFDYADVGKNIPIDNRKSPYLKGQTKYGSYIEYQITFHDISGMMHTLSGYNGDKGAYDLQLMNRSLVLANMASDLLKEEYKIPPAWWVEKNKGVVLTKEGRWILPQINPADHDLPDTVLELIKKL